MRLVCRECSAAYEAPDTLFGAQPREVRCNRCGFQWTVVGAVKAVTVAGPQTEGAPPKTSLGGMPPEFMRGPAMPPDTPAAAPGSTAEDAPAKTSALADSLAGPLPGRTPDPILPKPPAPDLVVAQPVVAPPSPATRSLLTREETEADLEMGDPEERRLSHELSFGETERAPAAHRAARSRGRSLWLLVMLVVVVIIAAILFKPQLLGAVPALGGLYAAIGL